MLLNGDEDSQTLSRLGLTGTEARAYLALVKSGPSRATEIAKVSNMARPDVYRTISRLQNLGLVKRTVSSPNEFSAIPIFDALVMLFQRRKNEQAELTEKADILLEKYNALQKNASKEKVNQFILIPEKETLIRERTRAMDNAKEKILLMIPLKKLGPVLTNSFESFSKAIERKVSFQIITEKTENENALKKLSGSLDKTDYFEVRTVPPPLLTNFGIYDGKEIRLSTSSKSGYAGAPEIWSNNPDIIELAQDYFKIKWTTATPTKTQKKREKERKEFSARRSEDSLSKY